MTSKEAKEFPLSASRASREIPLFMPGDPQNELGALVEWLRWVHILPDARFGALLGRSRNPFLFGPQAKINASVREACYTTALWVVESFGLADNNQELLTEEFVRLLGMGPVDEEWRKTAKEIQGLWIEENDGYVG